jgi:hypothetical protein
MQVLFIGCVIETMLYNILCQKTQKHYLYNFWRFKICEAHPLFV